ncbi:MerR family transcriptional regulator [Hydromonas duriensis]|uniref:MerR-like DNA binding protein n=1 Tax=Hydromonas duriensis TaxID=1527608 RepID=A0A4R6YA12_9BURK|nr:MerR family transcriptional regulator [Hydromonas duriensis]TDR32335.1 MerR-like DNA binding protein [Hydromonas duriensis]
MSQPQGYVLTQDLPAIPAKRYFTIGEVSQLCGVRSYVLRYWEQEFAQLSPMKRRGNRRYYQHHEVVLVRKIRQLLYEQGYTIQGARQQLGVKVTPSLAESQAFELSSDVDNRLDESTFEYDIDSDAMDDVAIEAESADTESVVEKAGEHPVQSNAHQMIIDDVVRELRAIRALLTLPKDR